MLTDDQKRTGLDISRYLLSSYEDDTGNLTQIETWVHHFDPESKMQSKQWKHPGSTPPKKFKRVRSAGKVMASIIWDSQGVIIIDYLEQGCTKQCILCRRFDEAKPGHCKKEARKTDLWCSALAGQRPYPHVTSCHDCWT